MVNNPLVSIVIPTYNQHENFLRECIESAINQTYNNIEIIISDNHSANGATEIIAEYAQKDTRIRSIKPPQFLSMVDHFIFAYDHILGEYICPLSSDDILYPEIVEEQLKPFNDHPGLPFCYSIPLYFSTEMSKAKWTPGTLDTGFYSSQVFLESYIKRRDCSWGAILIKTSAFRKIGGISENVNFAADTDTIINFILAGGGVYCINKPLSAIRIWERTELTNRAPFVLAEVAHIYDKVDKLVAASNFKLDKKITADAKRAIFAYEIYPIAYFTIFKKRDPDILEKTAAVIKENYPTGLFNFIVNNRKNVMGLFFSLSYLSIKKVKRIFGL